MGLRRFVFPFVLCGVVASSQADVVSEATHGNAGLRVKIVGVDQGQEVSGTNVNFTAWLEAFIPQNPVAPFYHGVYAEELRIKIGETVVYHAVHPAQSVPQVRPVRFASTHFQNGSTVPVEVKAKLACFMWSGYPPVQVVQHRIEVTTTANLVSYNQSLSLATHEEYVEGVGYVFNGAPAGLNYSFSALMGALGAKNILSANQHLTMPSSGLVNEFNETELRYALRSDTVFIAFTHGEATGIRASYDDSNSDNGDEHLTWSEISAVPRFANVPRNLVLAYACHTLTAGGAPVAAFGVNATNRAYTGFADRVYAAADVANGNDLVLLSMHSDYVVTLLAAKHTIQEALSIANSEYPPQSSINGKQFYDLPMQIGSGSDVMMRLFNVYAEDSTKLALWRNQWYCLP